MKVILLNTFMFISLICYSQKSKVYLFHGQGSDFRIFSELKLDTALLDTVHIRYPKITRKQKMEQFARLLIPQIDTSKEYFFIGVSFGGMIASELTYVLSPKKTIIVSSAQNKLEIPKRYRFMKYLPLHKLMPAVLYKSGSRIAQPLFERDRKKNNDLFVSMLKNTEPYFFKGVTKMMIGWELEKSNDKVIHIHGDNDHTLQIKNCKVNYVIENGSHMMMITRSEEINKIINHELLN